MTWLVAAGVAALSACASSGGARELTATLDGVEPPCGDTISPTAIVMRGSFPVLPRVSLSDPDQSEIDATYRAWLRPQSAQDSLGDVELVRVLWRDPGSLTASVPASLAAGVYTLTLESPWGDRVTAAGGFEIRPGGCAGVPGALAVDATVAPNAVTVGQQVTVTAVVHNTGQRTVFDVEAAVSSAPGGAVLAASAALPRDVAGGQAATFTWSYRMTEVTGGEGGAFTVFAAGKDDAGSAVAAEPATTNTLLVNPPANVTAHTEAPAAANVDRPFTFTVAAANTGAAPARVGAVMTSSPAGPAVVTILSSPPGEQDVPANGDTSFVWTLAADAPCDVVFSVGVTATDLNSGQPLTAPAIPPLTVTVQRGAALVTTVEVAPVVAATDTVTVQATVRNTGQATASAVTAAVFAAPALFDLEASPEGQPTIAGGASATFAWTYRAGAGASVGTFEIDAAGTDANSAEPVAAPRAASTPIAVAYPVGGAVAGLAGPGLVLRNGDEELAPGGDGAFTFPTPVASGASYAVTVAAQPPGQSCAVTSGAGTVASSAVTDVIVTCATTMERDRAVNAELVPAGPPP